MAPIAHRPRSLLRSPVLRGSIVAGLVALGLSVGGADAALNTSNPGQSVAASAAALRSARSYEVDAYEVDGKVRTTVELLESSNAWNLTVGEGAASIEVRFASGGYYGRGNAAFWESTGKFDAHAAAIIAGRWFREAPNADTVVLATSLANPARCLTEDTGSLSIVGTTKLNGISAIVIREAGGVPGSAPGTLTVAAVGPPYPLALVTSGPQLRGGPINACNDGKGDPGLETVNFSRFNAVGPIEPPPGAIDLPKSA